MTYSGKTIINILLFIATFLWGTLLFLLCRNDSKEMLECPNLTNTISDKSNKSKNIISNMHTKKKEKMTKQLTRHADDPY